MTDARETLITCAMYATMAVILVVKWKMNTDALLRKYALLRAGLLIRGGDSRSDSQNVLTNLQSYLQTYLKSNLQQTAAAVAQFKYMIDNAAATAVGSLALTGDLLDEDDKRNEASSSSRRKVPKRGSGDGGGSKRLKRRKRNPEVQKQLKIVLDALGSLQPGSGSGSVPTEMQPDEQEMEQTVKDELRHEVSLDVQCGRVHESEPGLVSRQQAAQGGAAAGLGEDERYGPGTGLRCELGEARTDLLPTAAVNPDDYIVAACGKFCTGAAASSDSQDLGQGQG